MRPRIFLSYRRGASADLARWLRDNLHQLGLDVFFDVESINAGRFAEIIEKEIRRRDYFIVILTPNTLESEWVRREIKLALESQRKIIPITTQGFTFSDLPSEIGELSQYSGIPYQYEYSEQTLRRIKKALGMTSSRTRTLTRILGIIALISILGIASAILVNQANSKFVTPPIVTSTPILPSPIPSQVLILPTRPSASTLATPLPASLSVIRRTNSVAICISSASDISNLTLVILSNNEFHPLRSEAPNSQNAPANSCWCFHQKGSSYDSPDSRCDAHLIESEKVGEAWRNLQIDIKRNQDTVIECPAKTETDKPFEC